MDSSAESQKMVFKKLWEIMHTVVHDRPKGNKKYDQVYMNAEDMWHQIKIMEKYIADKDIVFLGDGDGISILIALLIKNKRIKTRVKSITVLDFDERILKNYSQLSEEFGIEEFHCHRYNVIQPLPRKFKQKYDFFYINPPFGSKNNGNSCIAWLHRCIELCNNNSSGCIIMPYMKNEEGKEWTVNNMHNIQEFLINNGFVMGQMNHDIHRYRLKDNPNLKSSTFFVDRVKNALLHFDGKYLPDEFVVNMYGDPREIPEYISDDESKYGKLHLDWKYGQKEWWLKK